MKHAFLDNMPEVEMFPGFHGKFIHSANMTFAYWNIAAGSTLPLHSHVHEQVVNQLEGRFEITVDGQPMVLEPGAVLVIPSNAPHSGRALTDCEILDVFNPVREDYRAAGQPKS